jgi:hypothetical protein
MGISTRSREFEVTKGAKGYNGLGLPNVGEGSIMASELENSDVGMRRTRRNIMKMGAILFPPR